jgi:hypothetical protein
MEHPQFTRFVGDLTRAELLAEIRELSDVDGLNHAGELDGREIRDPTTLDVEALRELLKLARFRALLWESLDE